MFPVSIMTKPGIRVDIIRSRFLTKRKGYEGKNLDLSVFFLYGVAIYSTRVFFFLLRIITIFVADNFISE